jgi:spoIIIJ-associated protein
VIVDVEGYRSRREESLVGLAERVARQVARSKRPIELEPMPPNERRVIHIALRSHPEVATQSTGEGNQRRITVEPRA